MGNKGNISTPKKAGISLRTQSTPLRDDESIREALEEYMPESDSLARRAVEDSLNAFLNKKNRENGRLFASTVATLSFPGPSSSATRKMLIVSPILDYKFSAREEALLSPTGKSSEILPFSDFLLTDSDFEVGTWENVEGIDEDENKNSQKQKPSRKRSASSQEPSSKPSRKRSDSPKNPSSKPLKKRSASPQEPSSKPSRKRSASPQETSTKPSRKRSASPQEPSSKPSRKRSASPQEPSTKPSRKRSPSPQEPNSKRSRKRSASPQEQRSKPWWKKSASPREPSTEIARKIIRANIERSKEDEMKKELMRLEIKNKEVDINVKEALIYYYKLKSYHLETQLGIVPSGIPVTLKRDM